MTNYRRQVTAAVTFARQDAVYQQYRRMGAHIAASFRLADRFGTWVAFDACKAMGHGWWAGNLAR
jgi:hypothetical protein